MPTKEIEISVNNWNKQGYVANRSLHKVALQTDGLRSFGTSIELDGFKIKGLRDVSLDAPLGDAPVITISFIPGHLEFEAAIPIKSSKDLDELEAKVRQWIIEEMRKQ